MKKRLIKIFSLVIAFALSFSFSRIVSFAQYAGTDPEWDQYSSDYYYRQMNAEQKELYDKLYEKCMELLTTEKDCTNIEDGEYYTDYVEYDESLGSIEREGLVTATAYTFANSNPQFYFVAGDNIYGYRERVGIGSGYHDRYYICIRVYDEFADGSDRADYTERFSASVNRYMAEVNLGRSAYDKERIAHNIITRKLSYDENANFDQSSASAFLTNSSVCAGYSEGLELLLNGAGFECIPVTSEDHEWLQVKLDGTWYAVDVTWDDSDGFFAFPTQEYLNVSDATLLEADQESYDTIGSHVPEAYYAKLKRPACNYDYPDRDPNAEPEDPDPVDPEDPDPTDPVDPEDPDPTDPVDPEDPDPTDPVDPEDPDPTDPVDPEDPDPTDPVDPEDPDPTDPIDPEDPDPTDPVDPEDPDPTDPVDPEDPDPTDPIDPKDPDPTDPIDPEDPDPTDPVDPEDPDPTDPVDPEDPDPTDPIDPEDPDPTDPVDPEDPDPVKPKPDGTGADDYGLSGTYMDEDGDIALFRLYNPNSGEHFYTSDVAERRGLIGIYGWKGEGIIGYFPANASSDTVPIFRFYNPNTGDHHYASDPLEISNIIIAGWKAEGFSFYSVKESAGVPIYRLYNPNALAGAHHFTSDMEECNYLVRLGWRYEGIAWFAQKLDLEEVVMDKDRLERALFAIREKTDFVPKVGLVLGSGLGGYAESGDMEVVSHVDYKDITGFPVSTAPGHMGRYVFGYVGKNKVPVVCMQGRVHYYEGYDMEDVVLPIRLMGLMGADTIFITNASGGIKEGFTAGDLMLITDQISFFVPSPLRGKNDESLGERFPDMSEIYDKDLQALAKEKARELSIELKEGVYVQTKGPNYESPAEIQFVKAIGADAVGMSTACEAIAANHMQKKIIGISCISNLAAGISEHPLSGEEVLEAGKAAAPKFTALVTAIINDL